MNKCAKIIIETQSYNSDCICNILRRLGFINVIANEERNETTNISIFIRNSDKDYILYQLLKHVMEFSKKYDREIMCRIREASDISLQRDDMCSVYDIYTSFNGLAVQLDSVVSIEQSEENDIYTSYINENVKKKIIISMKDNEFINSLSSYMDTFKNNIMILSQIKNDNIINIENSKIFISGNNIGTYVEIFDYIFCNNHIQLDTIPNIDNIDINTINISKDYSIFLINTISFKDNIRDMILHIINNRNPDSIIILSGIYDLHYDHYAKQLSDINYKIIRTNRWSSFVIGDIGTALYDGTIGNGY